MKEKELNNLLEKLESSKTQPVIQVTTFSREFARELRDSLAKTLDTGMNDKQEPPGLWSSIKRDVFSL